MAKKKKYEFVNENKGARRKAFFEFNGDPAQWNKKGNIIASKKTKGRLRRKPSVDELLSSYEDEE